MLISGRHLIWYECEMVWCLLQYSTITIKTSKDNKTVGAVQVKNRWLCSNVFTVNFDRILHSNLCVYILEFKIIFYWGLTNKPHPSRFFLLISMSNLLNIKKKCQHVLLSKQEGRNRKTYTCNTAFTASPSIPSSTQTVG